MATTHSSNTILLPANEHNLRLERVFSCMESREMHLGLISTNANIYYLTGRVFNGFILLDANNRTATCFVRRPVDLKGPETRSIRKIENIAEILASDGFSLPGADDTLGLELDAIPYSSAMRILAAMGNPNPANLSAAMRVARSVKTPFEISMLKHSAAKHIEVYHAIPGLFSEGMTDTDLQIAIEHKSRVEGCLGQFRISGSDMELYMGNILAGDNADAPSPYDFAMGGAGQDASLPVGANGTILKPSLTVMVDMNGNFTGYMTDMTRTFAIGDIAPRAVEAHNLSIAICRAVEKVAKPGTEAKSLYKLAEDMAEQAGMRQFFMGHRQQAGFIGHGIGIEVNELPVLAPRSRDILCEGNIIALEPKFVIPGTRAVGIENTYVVTPNGLECLTPCDESLKNLLA